MSYGHKVNYIVAMSLWNTMIMFTSTGGIGFVVTNENKLLPPCTDLSLSHITAFVVNAEGLL